MKIPSNMKYLGIALAAGIAFAVYKNDLANKLLNSPALGLAPPAAAPTPAPTSYYPPPPAQQQQPVAPQPQYPAAPTGIPGVPNPLLSSITGMPVLPSSTLVPPVPHAGPYPIGYSPYAPFPFQVNTAPPGAFPFPGFGPSPLPPNFTIPNINQVAGLPQFQSTVSNAGSRVDFYNPSSPPPATQPTTTTAATSSVAYAHRGTRAYKAGKFGSMRDSAFQISPLQQEAISNSYRRPAFYAPETLSNI